MKEKISLYKHCIENNKEYLIEEWDDERNLEEFGLTMHDISYGSDKKVHWRDDFGHKWLISPSKRTRSKGSNCPHCNAKKVLKGFDNLITTHPKIASQWHPTKNKGLKPTDVTFGSAKKVWWLNDTGLEWRAKICQRTQQGDNPNNYGVTLIVGFNDLASTNPKIASQWHPTKNGMLKPENITFASSKKVWWLNDTGLEWQAQISKRTQRGDNPNNYGVTLIVGFNDLASTNPKIASEWHPTKNGMLKPENITSASKKNVWWINDTGLEWQTQIFKRTQQGDNPNNYGVALIIGFNDLASTNPKIASQWHPTKNGMLKPENITFASGKKVWWLNDTGLEWQAQISKRTQQGDNPNNYGVALIIGFNDLASTNPKIASEWHPTKNGKLKPENITFASNKKVWWKCECGHEWSATINNRSSGRGCPKCKCQTSFAEQYFYYGLKQIFKDVQSRKKINGYEYDIFVKDINLLIEYDGYYYHRVVKDGRKREKEKTEIARELGYDFIRIREIPSNFKKIKSDKYIVHRYDGKTESMDESFYELIDVVNTHHGLNIDVELSSNVEKLARQALKKTCSSNYYSSKTHINVRSLKNNIDGRLETEVNKKLSISTTSQPSHQQQIRLN